MFFVVILKRIVIFVHVKQLNYMKAIIKINVLNLKGTMHNVNKFENDLFYINIPFLSDFIVLTFLPNQVEIFN